MTVQRTLTITEAAYAVLVEMKRGDAKWSVQRPEPGIVALQIDSETYDKLLAKREEVNLATLSDVIIYGYKLGPGAGTLGSEPTT